MRKSAGLWLAAVALWAGCNKDDPNQLIGGTAAGGAPCPGVTAGPSGGSSGPPSAGRAGATGGTGASSSSTGGGPTSVLDQRVLDYPEALRTASFKLVGNAPTLQQLEDLRVAADPKAKYEELVDALMADPRFAARMVDFWKNTMRMGGAAAGGKPSRDTAPTFAARLTVEGKPYTDLFTAATNTCPTFDGTSFVDGNCDNGPVTAGVLTDPGVHAQYFGNMAFRRNRFFQETFVCRKQPAELSAMPIPKGAGSYTSPWPFESIAGTANGGRVDFLDYSSAICANCHSTANHRAPLFAVFDANGQYQAPVGIGQDAEYAVQIPTTGTPQAKLSDWLPAGQSTAWKFGVPAATLVELGAAMAADEEVQACAVARVWNFAMSKGDIVNDAASVPTEVIATLLADFKANNHNLRATIRASFVHDDFVRF